MNIVEQLSPFGRVVAQTREAIVSTPNLGELKLQLLDLGIWVQLGVIILALCVGLIIRPLLAKINFVRNEKVQNLIHAMDFPLPAMLFIWLVQICFMLLGLQAPLLVTAATALFMMMLWLLVGRLELRKQPRFLLRGFLLVVLALLLTNQTETTINVLQAAKVQIGDFELNLWHIFKAIFFFAIIVWGVSQFNRLIIGALTGTSVTESGKALLIKFTNVLGLIIGGFLALQMLGIDLKALAVFGGAVGLGLGFGLKSIASNYIAGIILLLDKSLKPGDVIEVDQGHGHSTYGVIEDMKSRYIVVRPRNHADILIPNETLLINQVTNWSYKSRAIRQDIKVGVSYSSDMELVADILVEAIQDHPRVLKVPRPVCFIDEFGDSSVNFELRFWMRDPENGVKILKGALYMLVWKKLKEHNIQIPFPQRVLHMPANEVIKEAAKTKSKSKSKKGK